MLRRMRGAVVLLFLLAGPARADDAVLLDRVAARVDDKVILLSDVRAHMKGAENADARAVLDAMIDEALVQSECKRLGLTVNADEVQRAKQIVMQNNGLDDARFDAELKKQGSTWAEWEAAAREQLLEGKWLRLQLAGAQHPQSDAEMAAWAQKQRDELVKKLRAAAYVDVRL